MRRILALFSVCAITLNVLAVPARPGIRKSLTLTDGTIVSAELRGDETFNYYVLADGTPLIRTANGNWEPAPKAQLKALHESRLNIRNERRSVRLAKMHDLFRNELQVKRKDGGTVNKKKALVILVNFKDKAFLSTSKWEYFDQMFNAEGNPYGKNYGSVHEYFKAQSYGHFDLEFDIVGPYTLTYGYNYYGEDKSGREGEDAHPEEMVEEACKLADDDVNFQDYDWDNDGEVEQVYVFYAGYSQAGGAPSNTIWPHEWDLESAFQYNNNKYNYSLKLDGVRINTYACGSELYGSTGNRIDGIGTMCHEFSHCLGIPDFYDTTGSYLGMDCWDVMDYGCYNGDGFQPAGYTAYERWFCGWLEPTLLADPLTVTDLPAIQDEPVAYLLMKTGTTARINSTYYLMYNHQQKGWDESYGHGMLVQYVQYSASAWMENLVNNSSNQRMTLIPADGDFSLDASGNYTYSNLAGDPWPGTKKKTTFSWNGHTMSGITERNGLISFLFDGGTQLPTISVPEVNDDVTFTGHSFTATWNPVADAASYDLRYRVKPDKPEANERLLISDNFNKFIADQDGTKDLSSTLNNYTQVSGWSGNRVYMGPNGAKLGTSKSEGWMQTPMLTSTTGNLTIQVSAQDWYSVSGVPDGSSLVITLLEGIKQLDVHEVHTLTGADIVVQFTDVPAGAVVRFSSKAAGRRLYLSMINIYDGIYDLDEIQGAVKRAAAPTWTVVSGIKNTSYTVDGLSSATTYQFQLRSVTGDGASSAWSASHLVTLDNSTDIRPPLSPERDTKAEYYDLSGRRIGNQRSRHGIYVSDGRKIFIH